jgi:Dolichyl-phosphate-mannose-protein mannosyltransferase
MLAHTPLGSPGAVAGTSPGSTSATSPRPAFVSWIPTTIALIVSLRWLLGERHSVYGDEGQRLLDLFAGFATLHQGSVHDRIVNFYLFNSTYPPIFHLLGAPFALSAVDPVFGGRVYAQVLVLFIALVFYAIVRRSGGGRLAATAGVLTLLGTPWFVDIGRHYLLEPLLVLEVLLLLLLIADYYRAPTVRSVVWISALTAVGLLTKYNFFLYAAPLFIVPAVIELSRHRRAARRGPALLPLAAIIVVPPLVIAGPWYLARSTGAASATGFLGALYDAGLKPGITPAVFIDHVVKPQAWNYSPIFAILAVAAAVLYAARLLRVPLIKSQLDDLALADHVVISSAFIGALCVTLMLALTGMAVEFRWHFEVAYLFVAVFVLLGRLRMTILRIGALSALALAGALQLVVINFMPVSVPALLKAPDRGVTARPSTVPVGSELIARDIASHEKRVGGVKPGDFVYFLYHEHRGPHMGAVELYLRFEGAPMPCLVAGFFDRAIDVQNIFGAKYLVDEETGPGLTWDDGENRRYRRLMAHISPAFKNLLVEVSDVEGRFGHFKAYYVPREQITSEMVMETIALGRSLETVTPFLVLWDAQRIISRAKFEPVPGNTSLRDEIDAWVRQVPAAETALATMNREALGRYTARIKEIRKEIGEDRPAAR